MDRFWTILTALLVIIIVAGGIIIWLRYSPEEPVEISLTENDEPQEYLHIYVDGAVRNPGLYPLMDGDTVDSLIEAAGGITDNADVDGFRLYIPDDEEGRNQKIDINRAQAWLLEALPGIGDTLAQRIVDYRLENGPYRYIDDLQKVPGIGAAVIEQIKDLITVSD